MSSPCKNEVSFYTCWDAHLKLLEDQAVALMYKITEIKVNFLLPTGDNTFS